MKKILRPVIDDAKDYYYHEIIRAFKPYHVSFQLRAPHQELKIKNDIG